MNAMTTPWLLAACLLLAAQLTSGQHPNPGTYDLYEEIKTFRMKYGAANTGFLIPPGNRDELGSLLEALGGFTTGVELGVQNGLFANITLTQWKSCTKYYLVDLWRQQENYQDGANVDNSAQDAIMERAKANMASFGDVPVFLRNYTTSAVRQVPGMVDYVYVDARHDYCAVKEDLMVWWLKIRPGGIMAGHDYITAMDMWPKEDWALCADGTRNKGAVMGAVNDFAMHHGLNLMVTWSGHDKGNDYRWRSWIIRKPHRHTFPVPW